MSQDKTGSPSGQQPPANQISVTFLNRFVPSSKERLFLAGSFPGQPRLRVVGYYSDARLAALADNERHHVTAAMYPEGPGGRRDAMATAVWAIVFDDVGKVVPPQSGAVPISKGIEIDEDEFLFRPEPSWRIETSRGCYQYGYHLSPSPTPKLARRLLAALKKNPVLSRGLHSMGQYLRLPSGTNTKPGGEGFRTRLAGLGPSWSVEDFVAGFGLDLDAVTEAEATAAGVGRTEQLPPIAVGKLLALIPNTDLTDYDFWIRVGYASWGATGGSEDGRDLWVEWSARSAKFNVGQDTAKTWDSFSAAKASAATLRRIIEELHGPQSPERMEAESIFALEMFDEVDEDEVEKAAETAKVEKKLDELLAAIAKTQRVPQHHRSGDTAHWIKDDKVQTLRQAATSIVAPPVILTPYERGILSVLGGMPGLGKSLLILQQALAITYVKPKLLRHGQAALNFAGDVIYISNEDGLGIMKRRFRAWEKRHGLQKEVPPHEIIPLRSTLLNWDGKAWQPQCLEILEGILAYVRDGRDIAMIVVDTLATSVTGIDENQAKDINPVMVFLDRLAKLFWASVVFVHHVNKGAVASEDRSIVALKGSISIGGAVRGAVTLTPPTKDELAEYGWEGHEVVVEYVAKANDDRARYIACHYELETEDIEVGSAVDPAVTVAQPTPVLVPRQPTKAMDDVERMTAWFELLRAAVEGGAVVRVYSASATNVGANSAHHVLGASVKKAHEIVLKLMALKWLELVEERDPVTHRKIAIVGLTKAF